MSIRKQKLTLYSLTNFPIREPAEVHCISSPEVALRLKSMGISEGSIVEIIHHDFTSEKFVLLVGESRIALDKSYVKHILVRPLKSSFQTLKEFAVYDPLTNFFNRHFAEKVLKRELANPPYTLAIGDLDNFKKINDTYGHLAGDKVLKEVASVIRQNLRKTDLVVRWGGEEFLIFLKNTPVDVELGRLIADRIRRAYRRPSYSLGRVLHQGYP
ncbi:MAG: diguanylate cyclase [Caldimicrobium sp.]|jgi:GGDEF domain-containing protein|nr:diguanylate cyclase [Caldimicrobium sp.]